MGNVVPEQQRTTSPLVAGAGRTRNNVAQNSEIKDHTLALPLNFLSSLSLTSFILPQTDKSVRHAMCYQIVERYAVCKCLYHRHAIDPCNNYGRPGHGVTEKTVLVGFACPDHGKRQRSSKPASAGSGSNMSNDSGYASARSGRQ